MKAPTHYAKRLSQLENKYDEFLEEDNHNEANKTANSVNKLKREIRDLLNKGVDPNDEATATRRFHDVEKQYNEYYAANWVLFFAMLGLSITYFRRDSI